MALFNKHNLKSVVLIEKKSSENKFQPIATGFLVGFALDNNLDLRKRLYKIFLLTNRHVFNDQDELYLRFDKKDITNTTRFPIKLIINGEAKWLAHQNENIDLAMLTIDPEILNNNNVDWVFLNEEMFAYPENFNDIGIEQGDGIFFAGFPLGISGIERNYAIVRYGIISRIDQEIIDLTHNFIIDASVYPGNSGGPVFLKPELSCLDGTKAISSVYLLGVISGYIPYKESLYSHQSSPPIVAAISIENSGLGNVVPMNFVKDIYSNFITSTKTLEPEIKGEDKIINEKMEVSQK